eukprot:9502738-Pyramimonas_sp.AAC.2
MSSQPNMLKRHLPVSPIPQELLLDDVRAGSYKYRRRIFYYPAVNSRRPGALKTRFGVCALDAFDA